MPSHDEDFDPTVELIPVARPAATRRSARNIGPYLLIAGGVVLSLAAVFAVVAKVVAIVQARNVVAIAAAGPSLPVAREFRRIQREYPRIPRPCH